MMTDFDKGALSHMIDVVIPGITHAYGNDTAGSLLDAHIAAFQTAIRALLPSTEGDCT